MGFIGNIYSQSNRYFKWTPWKCVSTPTKSALKNIIRYGKKTAYDDVIEKIEDGCRVEIAVLDFDGDQKMEYAITSEEGNCCGGRAGCSLDVYKDGSRKQIHLGDNDLKKVKPSKNGVISSAGVLIKFYTVKS